jgi:hypothetical protein
MKLVFNVNFTKKMHKHFIFLLDPIFNLWEIILLEWERCNISDDSGEVPVCPPKLIKESTFC